MYICFCNLGFFLTVCNQSTLVLSSGVTKIEFLLVDEQSLQVYLFWSFSCFVLWFHFSIDLPRWFAAVRENCFGFFRWYVFFVCFSMLATRWNRRHVGSKSRFFCKRRPIWRWRIFHFITLIVVRLQVLRGYALTTVCSSSSSSPTVIWMVASTSTVTSTRTWASELLRIVVIFIGASQSLISSIIVATRTSVIIAVVTAATTWRARLILLWAMMRMLMTPSLRFREQEFV